MSENLKKQKTKKERQSELKRYRALLLATLDYQIQNETGGFVCDGYDPGAEYYNQRKLQTEKYFEQGRLDRLKQGFKTWMGRMEAGMNLEFEDYIKKKTGYDIDLFEDLKKRSDKIIEQKEIRNRKQLGDLFSLHELSERGKLEEERVNNLKPLWEEIPKWIKKYGGKNRGDVEIITREEKDGVITETITITKGPLPWHNEEEKINSPDGKKTLLIIRWGQEDSESTSVLLQFPKASGHIYSVNKLCVEIKAWWKDNNKVVIETGKGFKSPYQVREVRSFSELITIEYIEI